MAEPPAVCGALWAFLGAGRPLHRGLVLKSWSGTSAWLVTPRPHPGTAAPLSALMAPCGDTEVSVGFTTIPSTVLGGVHPRCTLPRG